MKHTYGASAQAQLFGIRTVRADELNPGMPPVIGLNVDTETPAVNTDIAVAVDSMVEQANSLGKVAAELMNRATRNDAPMRYREFIAAGNSEKDWEKYAAEQNAIIRKAGSQRVIDAYKGSGVSGNAIVNFLRSNGVGTPHEIASGLDHNDTMVSRSSVTGRMKRPEANKIHKWVTDKMASFV
jgi:hypothetical protein